MARYRKYDKEFKLQAAGLVAVQGYSYREASERLGVSAWSIRDWVRKYRNSGELPPETESQPEVDQVKELRKENSRLKMENEILKKAAAYFAKEFL